MVVEAEYESSGSGEADAKARLGLPVIGEVHSIEAAIALRYPDSVRDADDLRSALADARLTYAVFHDDDDLTRFPESGWLEGSVTDLADLIRLVSVPQKAVNAAADALEDGIDKAATILNQMAEIRPNASADIARLLGMADVTQTRRMASAILANALVFHERIAGMHDGVNNLELVCGPGVSNPKSATLDAWATILEINYWSIFAIARDILTQLPSGEAQQVLSVLRYTAEEFDATGVSNAHDLTGRIFQTLIADRKYLATFYTLPASAALLARLAVSKMDDVDWADPEAIGNLRIGDFACGTGALLSAVYDQIAARHERAGGDPSAIHKTMMEEVLYGCDVMPSAIHITGSTLSGAYPDVDFGQSRLYTLAYGRQTDCSVKIGSLELLQSSSIQSLFNTSDPASRTGSVGEQTASRVTAEIADRVFDVVIMNPPFTRNTNKSGAYSDTFAGAFAAFNTTKADQSDMAKHMAVLKQGTCYHGHAGMASAFVSLADRKLKPGGVFAMVLPLSASSGFAWQNFRDMLASRYSDIMVVSLSAADNEELAFSADTGMADCLVVGVKNEPVSYDSSRQSPVQDKGRARFVSLEGRPNTFVEASELSRPISVSADIRSIEDGPYGGTPVRLGARTAGAIVTAPLPVGGSGWGAVRIADYAVAQTAHSLSTGRLWLPGCHVPEQLPMVRMGDLGTLGYHHLDITGMPASGIPQGPFDKTPPSPTATYPALWNHDAKRETRLICGPDSQLEVRVGMEAKAAAVWQTAGRSHVNLDFRFNSQPLGGAFTAHATVGGRAWPNVNFPDRRFDYAYAVWVNSSLSLLMHWWHSNRQQEGRGVLTISSAAGVSILDLASLSHAQLVSAQEIFDDFRDRELQPAYLAAFDPNRAFLDRRVVCDLLGYDEDIYRAVRLLSAKWCAEPSVHGGKARPKSAEFVY